MIAEAPTAALSSLGEHPRYQETDQQTRTAGHPRHETGEFHMEIMTPPPVTRL